MQVVTLKSCLVGSLPGLLGQLSMLLTLGRQLQRCLTVTCCTTTSPGLDVRPRQQIASNVRARQQIASTKC